MIVVNGSGRRPRWLGIAGLILLFILVVLFAAVLIPAWIVRSLMKNLLGEEKLLFVGGWVLVALAIAWVVVAAQQDQSLRWPLYWLLVALLAKSSRSPLAPFARRNSKEPPNPKIIEI